MKTKSFYQESNDDGFGLVVIVGIITSIIQILAIIAVVVLSILWVITQDSSFGWALLWPIGTYAFVVIAALIFAGTVTIKAARDF